MKTFQEIIAEMERRMAQLQPEIDGFKELVRKSGQKGSRSLEGVLEWQARSVFHYASMHSIFANIKRAAETGLTGANQNTPEKIASYALDRTLSKAEFQVSSTNPFSTYARDAELEAWTEIYKFIIRSY
jgi:hypothetical protein